MNLRENEEKLSGLPLIKPDNDNNLVIRDVPFYGDMVFKPAIVQWNGTIPNPFFADEKFKTVNYYLTKTKPGRVSKDKNTLILTTLFDQHPELKTDENLNLPLGKFAFKLKNSYPNLSITIGKRNKQIPVGQALVNQAGGEEDYISFKADVPKDKGLYIWVVDNTPQYIGVAGSPNGLANRVNNEYGAVTSYKCSIDGQSQTCRSNTKLRDEFKAKVELKLSSMS